MTTEHARLDELITIDSSTRAGLLLPPALSYDDWAALAPRLGALVRFSQWMLGDWLIYGEAHFGSLSEQAVSLTSCDYSTIRNAKWIARTFPPARRRADVSFSHHVEVAALPAHIADELLARAAPDPDVARDDPIASEPRLSVRELRDEAKIRHALSEQLSDDPRLVAILRASQQLVRLARDLPRSTSADDTLAEIERIAHETRDALHEGNRHDA